ncbi:MAG TPA: LmeA family phospholipid-binding protein [Acidimicrobiales bacterium]|nr:LmeA family phospholipid-binding protein [Acidimicrobiales bacterium]
MRKWIVLGAVLAALVGLDSAAKAMAESQIEKKARLEAGADARASADIKSFPFLGKLLLSGNAGDITLSMKDVDGRQVRFSTLSIALADVHLDKAKLVTGKAEITSIRKGVITVGLRAAELEKVVRYPVRVSSGVVTVTVAGRHLTAKPVAAGGGNVRLEFQGAAAVTVPFPQTRLLNCPVSKVDVVEDELRASCEVTQIPPALLRAASRVIGG